MTRTTSKPVKIFCSYSRRDETYLGKLKMWLTGLRREGLIEEWYDRDILAGQEWEEAIEENLKASKIVLLLVTPDFVASDYSFEKEMNPALERHDRGEARVIPIIVRPTDWEWTPFKRLQALPKDATPITVWSNEDEAWLDVVRGLRKAVEELQGKRGEHDQKATSTQQDREEDDLLRRYREGVEVVWVDREVDRGEAEWLRDLTNSLGLNSSTAADIERGVMGDTKEAILKRQEADIILPVLPALPLLPGYSQKGKERSWMKPTLNKWDKVVIARQGVKLAVLGAQAVGKFGLVRRTDV